MSCDIHKVKHLTKITLHKLNKSSELSEHTCTGILHAEETVSFLHTCLKIKNLLVRSSNVKSKEIKCEYMVAYLTSKN